MNLNAINWSNIAVKAGTAVIVLIVTWVIAKVVKSLLTKYLAKIKALDRQTESGQPLSASLGSIGALLVWLFGLMAILNLFALNEVLTPIRDLLSGLFGALPRVAGAAFILVIGVVLARIVRELVVTALQAANVDRHLQRLSSRVAADVATDPQSAPASGPEAASTGSTLKVSSIVGQLLFALIVLVVGISALQVLGVHAISDPATQMLSTILDAVPLVIGAGILLAIGVVIARLIGGLVESALRGLGIERALEQAGIATRDKNAAGILTRVVQIAIVLFFAVAATRMLGFPQVTEMLNAVLALGGRVLFGAVVIVAGIFLAGLLARTIGEGRSGQVVRWATIALFVAMGLKYMGVADSIVNLAFGAVVVGAAVAAAIAFGFGGREAAARQLQRIESAAPAVPQGPTPL